MFIFCVFYLFFIFLPSYNFINMGEQSNNDNLTLAANTATSVAGMMMGAVNNKKAYKYSRRMAEYQNAWNLDQWNRANAYNAPSAQMQRLKDAGLNPNLVYGNGAGQSVAVQSPTAAKEYYNKPYDPTPAVQGMQQSILAANNLALQRQQLQIQSKVADATIQEKTANSMNAISHSALNAQLKDNLYTQYQYNVLSMNDRVEQQVLTSDLMASKWYIQEQQGTALELSNELALSTINARIRLANMQPDVVKTQLSQVASKIAQGWVSLGIEQKTADALAKKNAQETINLAIQGDMQGMVRDFMQKHHGITQDQILRGIQTITSSLTSLGGLGIAAAAL